MINEEILMKKLDELVVNGYGDALIYGCNIAVNAALKGYRKAEFRTVIFRTICCASATAIVYLAMKEREKNR